MKKRVKIFIFALTLLLMPLISAVDVSITIKTGPNSDVAINILNPDTLDAIQTLNINSSETGIASATISTGLSKIAVSAIIRKNGKIVKVVKAGDYGNLSTSSAITIDTLAELTPVAVPAAPVANIINSTANSSVNNTNSSVVNNMNTTASSAALSGSSTLTNVSANQSSFFAGIKDFVYKINYWAILKVIIYIVVGIAVLVAILLIIRWIKAKHYFVSGQTKTSQVPAVVKYSDREISEAEKRIKQAQEEIKQAQEQIDKIKNKKSEVKIAEENFLQAKRNLEKLKGRV